MNTDTVCEKERKRVSLRLRGYCLARNLCKSIAFPFTLPWDPLHSSSVKATQTQHKLKSPFLHKLNSPHLGVRDAPDDKGDDDVPNVLAVGPVAAAAAQEHGGGEGLGLVLGAQTLA